MLELSKLRSLAPLAVVIFSLPACASNLPAGDELGEETSDSASASDSASESDSGDDSTGSAGSDLDSCNYTSPFTNGAECREYVGAGWTEPDVTSDCTQVSGELGLGEACSIADVLGRCVVDEATEWELHYVIYGTDAASCSAQAVGCETFAGGEWRPTPICDGTGGDGDGDGGSVFIQPTRVCVDPLDGEAPGQSEGGQVCTWQSISASTEEGRSFADYASCDVVYSQRPYYAAPPNPAPAEPDPRLDDPTYMAELAWVTSQVEASACICCHSDAIAPNGASNWFIEAPNNWMNSFYSSGLALGANWIDSTAFGAYDPADNNGFDRINSGIPSTDPDRMVEFFRAELSYRGKTEADFADSTPFGGPLYTQMIYEPTACANGEGVAVDGTMTWTGGPARYVFVLAADSANPTVPPNLDLPEGTMWRFDVPFDGAPVASGEVEYGATPAGTTQRIPIAGAPDDLVPGQTYYLYVNKDVGIPITRCLFTYD